MLTRPEDERCDSCGDWHARMTCEQFDAWLQSRIREMEE